MKIATGEIEGAGQTEDGKSKAAIELGAGAVSRGLPKLTKKRLVQIASAGGKAARHRRKRVTGTTQGTQAEAAQGSRRRLKAQGNTRKQHGSALKTQSPRYDGGVKSEGCSLEAARAAKSKLARKLSRLAQVNGVGITRVGTGYGIKINLVAQPPAGVAIPEEIDGVPVVLEVVGRISMRRGG